VVVVLFSPVKFLESRRSKSKETTSEVFTRDEVAVKLEASTFPYDSRRGSKELIFENQTGIVVVGVKVSTP